MVEMMETNYGLLALATTASLELQCQKRPLRQGNDEHDEALVNVSSEMVDKITPTLQAKNAQLFRL